MSLLKMTFLFYSRNPNKKIIWFENKNAYYWSNNDNKNSSFHFYDIRVKIESKREFFLLFYNLFFLVFFLYIYKYIYWEPSFSQVGASSRQLELEARVLPPEIWGFPCSQLNFFQKLIHQGNGDAGREKKFPSFSFSVIPFWLICTFWLYQSWDPRF